MDRPSLERTNALFLRTLPRLEEWPAVEPCPVGTEMNPGPPKVWIAPPTRKAHPKRWRPQTVPIAELRDVLARGRRPLRLTDADFEALEDITGPDGHVVLLIDTFGRHRKAWLPPVRIATASLPPLPASLSADLAPPGQTQKVTIITHSERQLLRPSGEATRMAPIAYLPEVALEDPIDIQQAIRHQSSQRKGPRTIAVEYEARAGQPPLFVWSLGRYYFEQSERSRQADLRLARAMLGKPTEPRWTFRRVWRKKLSCDNPQLPVIIQQQQRTELKTYAVATGRRLAEITAQTVERGYGIDVDGRTRPVKILRSPRLRPVEPTNRVP